MTGLPFPDAVPPRLAAASAQIDAGRYQQARASLARLLRSDPGDVDAAVMICFVLGRLGEVESFLYYAQKADALAPDDPRLLVNLGNARSACNELAGAIRAYRRSLELDPQSLQARIGLSNVLCTDQLNDEAEAVCRHGLSLHPGSVPLRTNLGVALTHAGRAREGVAILRAAAADAPDDAVLATGLPYAMNYAGGLAPAEVFEAHLAYGRLVERQYGPAPARASTPRDPERPLRLGILSGDLRSHAVAFFIEPLLRHLNPASYSVTCYSTSRVHDAVSRRLETLVAAWRRVPAMPISDLNALIRRDRIDILLELSGHTGGQRLPVLHLGPAPVQVSYFGYPNTTGVRACDYRIVDSITDPCTPEFDVRAAERLIRLDPCFLCYQPPEGAPAVSPAPCARAGFVTFGSFNALAKLDPECIGLYAGALHASPGSRLLLKCHGLKAPGVREDVARRFAESGVERDRLILEPPGAGAAEMLHAYGRMDIMLDSFPYNGTTTTCEALFMGIPVVTLRGGVCAARVSASILAGAGLPQWVASTPEHYVRIATELAGDAPGLERTRAGLRDRFLASAVCDGAGFAARFDLALRSMWRRYCGTTP